MYLFYFETMFKLLFLSSKYESNTDFCQYFSAMLVEVKQKYVNIVP